MDYYGGELKNKHGYARTSKNLPDELHAQKIASLRRLGCHTDHIFQERTDFHQASPVFEQAIEACKSGDAFVLDNLADAAHTIYGAYQLVRRLDRKKASLEIAYFNGAPLMANSELGQNFRQCLFGFTEMDEQSVIERRLKAIRIAASEGLLLGRKPKIEDQTKTVVQMIEHEGLSAREIMQRLNVPKTSVYRIMKMHKINKERSSTK
jgi:DNA invertase Pin-like site-specific DNA recombinase